MRHLARDALPQKTERVDSRQLEFQAVKSKIKWGTYFIDLIRPRYTGFDSYSGGPSVVAENSNGEKRVIAVFKSFAEAKDGVVRIESDFKKLGADAWCEHYGVPPDFVS